MPSGQIFRMFERKGVTKRHEMARPILSKDSQALKKQLLRPTHKRISQLLKKMKMVENRKILIITPSLFKKHSQINFNI